MADFVRRVASDYRTEAEIKKEVQRLMKAGRHDLAALMRAETSREQFEASQELERARRTRLRSEAAQKAIAAKKAQRERWDQMLAERRALGLPSRLDWS